MPCLVGFPVTDRSPVADHFVRVVVFFTVLRAALFRVAFFFVDVFLAGVFRAVAFLTGFLVAALLAGALFAPFFFAGWLIQPSPSSFNFAGIGMPVDLSQLASS